MLNLMRKKAGSWMIKVILFAIVVVFILWGVGNYRSRKTTHVANINGTVITYDVYRQAYFRLLDQYRRIYGSRLDEEMLKTLRLNEIALDQLVHRVLMLQEAQNLGLRVTPKEVAAVIHQIPAFQKNGVFDYNQYTLLLARNNLTPETFEKDQEETILLERLRSVILDGVTMSEADVRQWYDWQNTRINLSYLLFPLDRYQDISPTDEEIEAYFNENENNYLTDPQVKIRYLFFDPKAFESAVTITGEEIERYYYGNPDEFFSEKTVSARHILFKLDSDAEDQVVEEQKNKAMKVYDMAKKGEDFAELARKYSEGPTRSNGGDLGTFTRDTMVKPFADKAFSMSAGEISEPIRTQFGWHIIKVEKVNEASSQSLSSAESKIEAKLKAEKARGLALEKAESVYDSLFDGDDLSAVKTSESVVFESTDFFTSKNPPKKLIESNRKLLDTAFELEEMAISDILETDSGYYMLQVEQRIDPAVPPLENVFDRVRNDVINEKQDEMARADSQAALDELKNGKELVKIASDARIQVQETGLISRNGAIPQLGYNPEINRLGFALSESNPLAQEVIKADQGWLVIKLVERVPPDGTDYEKEKDNIESRLTAQKRQETLQSWLDDLKSRGTVEINEELIR